MAKTQSHRLLLLGAIFISFALRHFRLGGESLWYDETVSVYLAQKSIPALLAHTAGDIHPPGYYLLLHFWQLLTHPTLTHGLEFLYAWPSLFFGMLIVVLIYALGQKLLNVNIGLIAAWLVALHPFQLWYSQEVRMYTLGAFLGLLCWWSLLQIADDNFAVSRTKFAWLATYAIAAAAGMYTLYYFVFLLIALNWIALLLLRRNLKLLASWLLAQLVTLLLWSPWLPVFYQQAIDPPVPPWRVPWNSFNGLLTSLTETFAVLVAGQSLPVAQNWLWTLLSLLLIALFFYAKFNQSPPRSAAKRILLIYIFLPIALIYLISYFVTPLYHVRYLFTYTSPVVLLTASMIERFSKRSRAFSALLTLLLIGISSVSLYEFWTNPIYRADDHRSAVSDLAKKWRPGDQILVNAGWAYPPLLVYWPTELVGAMSALPPRVGAMGRLGDGGMGGLDQPAIVRTGSIGGEASLGWGDPDSDFFAISVEDSIAALEQLAQQRTSLWHYRIYDTVSDPQAILRNWLGGLQQVGDQAYAGRDYLRVQHFLLNEPRSFPFSEHLLAATFNDKLQLSSQRTIGGKAGKVLYTQLDWVAIADLATVGSDLSMSLRLYDAQGWLIAQSDEAPLTPTSQWQTDHYYAQAMALGIPVSTKPGFYSLELVVYRQDTGEALRLPTSAMTVAGQRLKLRQVAVQAATQIPEIESVLATFDYIDLVAAQLNTDKANKGDSLQLELIWRAQASAYHDTYAAGVDLVDTAGKVVQSWRGVVGGDDDPSAGWPTLIPLREFRVLSLAADLNNGTYAIEVRLERESDRLPITASSGWWRKQEKVRVGEVTIR